MKKYATLLVTASLAITGCSKKEEAVPPAPPKPPRPTVTQVAPDAPAPTDQAAPPPGPPGEAPKPKLFAPFDPNGTKAPVEPVDTSGKLTAQDLQNLNYAIDMYHTEFGRYPASIEAMLGTRHLARVPVAGPGQTLTYDPKVGQAKITETK